MYKLFLIFSLLFATSHCEKTQASTQETKTIFIGSKLVDCTGLGPQKCMLYKENQNDEWTYFYDPITGFTYEEGYQYELEVNITQVPEPLADASSLLYTLVKVVSKEKDAITADSTIKQNVEITALSYEEIARGYHKKIEINAEQIALFKNNEEKASGTMACSSTDWLQLSKLCTTFSPTEIKQLEAPTNKRQYDGAAHAQLFITTADSTFASNNFDAGSPPLEIKAVTNRMLEMVESLNK